MDQYILDNTEDEFSHANFLLAYLKSKRADSSDVERLIGMEFRTLQGSMATGSTKKGRLTNLVQLTVETALGADIGMMAITRVYPAASPFPKQFWV